MRRQLEAISSTHSGGWTQDWIDLCLQNEGCQAQIRQLIQENVATGWVASDINFDNTRDGLHVNVTFERELRIPGLA
jgi:hypothetical protein